MTPGRAVQVSPAAAGDAITAAAHPDPCFEPDALAAWLIPELEGIIAGNHDEDTASRLKALLAQVREFPGQQAVPMYLIRAATRYGNPFLIPLSEATGHLTDPGVSCWWRPHPVLRGYDLLVRDIPAGHEDSERAGLFFQVTAPACTWNDRGEPR